MNSSFEDDDRQRYYYSNEEIDKLSYTPSQIGINDIVVQNQQKGGDSAGTRPNTQGESKQKMPKSILL